MKIRLELEFDGTDYFGWQLQPDRPTIQGALEKALVRVYGVPVRVAGAGRTDAGVSALSYTCAYQAPRRLMPARAVKADALAGSNPETRVTPTPGPEPARGRPEMSLSEEFRAIRAALNQALPRTIVVLRARPVRDSFHPRYDARSRTYCYTCVLGRAPLLGRHAWELEAELDAGLLTQAAAMFVGERDLAPFCRLPGRAEVKVMASAIRRSRCRITGRRLVQYQVTANRFLYKMVRRMIGAIVDVGRGKFALEELRQAIEARPEVQFATAPACGLLLVRVSY